MKYNVSINDRIMLDTVIGQIINGWYQEEMKLASSRLGDLHTGLGRLMAFDPGSLSTIEGIEEFDALRANIKYPMARLLACVPRIYAVVGENDMKYLIKSINTALEKTYGFASGSIEMFDFPIWLLTYLSVCQVTPYVSPQATRWN